MNNGDANMKFNVKYTFKINICSHNGRAKEQNEDNFFYNCVFRFEDKPAVKLNHINNSGKILLEICDGMGGEENGSKASLIAVEEANNLFEKVSDTYDHNGFRNAVENYVNVVNNRICSSFSNDNNKHSGTTMALAYIYNDMVYTASLGDSRIYIYSNNRLTQLTEDHTLAMRKHKMGIYSFDEAMKSKDSHKLTLFLGIDVDGNGLSAQYYEPYALRKGDILLLCSDGVYDMCSPSDISDILAHNNEPATEIVTLSVSNGGIDNATCITAELI